MAREYEPTVGQWYEDLENEESFMVLKVDEDQELIQIQHLDGDTEELDIDGWAEMDLELTDGRFVFSAHGARPSSIGSRQRRSE